MPRVVIPSATDRSNSQLKAGPSGAFFLQARSSNVMPHLQYSWG